MQVAGMLKRWRWDEPTAPAGQALADWGRQLGVHPLVAGLLRCRGLGEIPSARRFLSPRLTDLHDPALLPGATRAAQRMSQAVRQQQPIVVYGDYDVDGITASAILWHVLRLAGAQVSTYVPHRLEEGYGLNCHAIEQLSPPCPLIVTVDCGITAVEPARVARAAGVDLIITDHHELPGDVDEAGEPGVPEGELPGGLPGGLPGAYSLVHPRLPGSGYPFGQLCGAGVAFKLAWEFARVHCGSRRLPEAYRGLLVDLLSFVALGTIADVVPLVGENRVLTVYGLRNIKQTRFEGLNALIDASGLRDERIDAYHVGFGLAPRLNACGRMGHAADAVELFTSADATTARPPRTPRTPRTLADTLSKQNERRRAVERAILDQAKQRVVAEGYDRPNCRVIVLGQEGWHRGVVGIVASRLVDLFGRPVVLMSYEEGRAHGSARSVAGVSIHDGLKHCAGCLDSFGGHAMAAGLRLARSRVEELRQGLDRFVQEQSQAHGDPTPVLDIDGVCPLEQVDLTLFDQIGMMAPFGSANPSPVLCARGVTVDRPAQRMGSRGRHLRLVLRDGPRLAAAVGFGMGDLADQLPAGVRLHVAFEPHVSTWQGRRRAEMHVKDIHLLPVGDTQENAANPNHARGGQHGG